MKQSQTRPKANAAQNKNLPGVPLSTPLKTEDGLMELFTDGIKDMLWSENHLVKSIPKMIAAAGAPDLKNAFSNHLAETERHAANLEAVLELLGEKIAPKKCDACEGLVMSGEHTIENTVAGTEARDTGLIASALKVENFEITTYDGLIQLANKLGQAEAANLLMENLADEVRTDTLLKTISDPGDSPIPAKKASPKKK